MGETQPIIGDRTVSELTDRAADVNLQHETTAIVTMVIFDLVKSAFIPQKRRGLRDRISEIVLAGLQAYQQQKRREQLKKQPSRN
jgi:hypothetical protein